LLNPRPLDVSADFKVQVILVMAVIVRREQQVEGTALAEVTHEAPQIPSDLSARPGGRQRARVATDARALEVGLNVPALSALQLQLLNVDGHPCGVALTRLASADTSVNAAVADHPYSVLASYLRYVVQGEQQAAIQHRASRSMFPRASLL